MALALREQVATADPNDVNARGAVTRAHLSIGQVYRRAGRGLEAIPHFRQALAMESSDYEAEPSNDGAGERVADVYGALAGTNADLAAVRDRQGRGGAALGRGPDVGEEEPSISGSASARRARCRQEAKRNWIVIVALIAKCDVAMNSRSRKREMKAGRDV